MPISPDPQPTFRSAITIHFTPSPPRTKWEPVNPDKRCVLSAVLWFWGLIHPSFLHLSLSFHVRLLIKRHYGCMAKARSSALSFHGGLFDPTTFYHSTDGKWDGGMTNGADGYITLMSSRMTAALPFPRCWVWWCLKIVLAANMA